jgi:hypothetical protein
MLAYILLACFVVPLLILAADVMRPRKDAPPTPVRPSAPRPHVQAAANGRRAAHAPGDAETGRPPRIAPGDGMVYRGSARSR